jgi:hypothetical protein
MLLPKVSDIPLEACVVTKKVADSYATYVVIHLAAVLGITSCAADFLGPSGIRVNSISPSIAASKLMGDRLVSFDGF